MLYSFCKDEHSMLAKEGKPVGKSASKRSEFRSDRLGRMVKIHYGAQKNSRNESALTLSKP